MLVNYFLLWFSQEDAGDLIADIFGDSDEEEEAFEVFNTNCLVCLFKNEEHFGYLYFFLMLDLCNPR